MCKTAQFRDQLKIVMAEVDVRTNAKLKEALEKLARFEAQSAGQEVVAAPAVEAGASPAVAAAPAGERGGAGTAQ